MILQENSKSKTIVICIPPPGWIGTIESWDRYRKEIKAKRARREEFLARSGRRWLPPLLVLVAIAKAQIWGMVQ